MTGKKVTLTPEDREALKRYYKPLPADHPLRGKVFFVPVPKRDEGESRDTDMTPPRVEARPSGGKETGEAPSRRAISNNRLLDIDDGKVTFRWKDYRDGNVQKTMTLAAAEFIRRFLLHVLPPGLQRIRYYGFLGNRYRQDKLAQCRQLLQMTPSMPTAETAADAPQDYRERHAMLTGISLHQCPVCHQGRMLIVEQLNPPHSSPPIIDSS